MRTSILNLGSVCQSAISLKFISIFFWVEWFFGKNRIGHVMLKFIAATEMKKEKRSEQPINNCEKFDFTWNFQKDVLRKEILS